MAGNHCKAPKVPQERQFHVQTHSAYIDWLETADNNTKSEFNLTLTVPNLTDTIKQAAKEDLLEAHAAHQEAFNKISAKEKFVRGEDGKDKANKEGLDTIHWEHINTHMTKRYEKN